MQRKNVIEKRAFIHPYVYPAIPIYHGKLAGIADYTTEMLLDIICQYFGVSEEEIKSESRQTNIVNARHTYTYMLSTKFRMSQIAVGKKTGRHRTTVLISNLRFAKRKLKTDVLKIERLLLREVNKKASLEKATFI